MNTTIIIIFYIVITLGIICPLNFMYAERKEAKKDNASIHNIFIFLISIVAFIVVSYLRGVFN